MKHISEIQKHEAFIKYICGYSPQELANEFNVHFTTVYRWVSTWQKDLSCRKLTDLSIQVIGAILTYTEELRQQLIDLERSTAIIHESKVMQIIPMEQRIDMAVSLLDTYPVSTLCQTFEINRSTLYYHKRTAQNGSKRLIQDNQISTAIAEIFKESGNRFGAERIRVQLEKRGIKTSKKRIIRLMKRMGLYNKSAERPYYPSSNADHLETAYDVQILQ